MDPSHNGTCHRHEIKGRKHKQKQNREQYDYSRKPSGSLHVTLPPPQKKNPNPGHLTCMEHGCVLSLQTNVICGTFVLILRKYEFFPFE